MLLAACSRPANHPSARSVVAMSSINPYSSPEGDQQISEPHRVPATLSEIVATGTSLFVNHLGTWVAMVLAVWLPIELGSSYMRYFVVTVEEVDRFDRMNMVLENLIGIVVLGGVIQIGSDAWHRQPISWLKGLAAGLAAWPRLLVTRIVIGIAVVLGLLLLVLPGLYLAVRTALAEVSSVLEQNAGTKAMRRSIDLTSGKFFRYVLLIFTTYPPLFIFAALLDWPRVLFPHLDHWLVAAALRMLIYLAEPWIILIFVAAFISEVEEEKLTGVLERDSPAVDVR